MQQYMARIAELPEFIDPVQSTRSAALRYVNDYSIGGTPEEVLNILQSTWKDVPYEITRFINQRANRSDELRTLTFRIRNLKLHNIRPFISGVQFI